MRSWYRHAAGPPLFTLPRPPSLPCSPWQYLGALAAALLGRAGCCLLNVHPLTTASPLLSLKTLPWRQRDDLRALAVVLLECILSAMAASGPSQLTTADSIQVGVQGVW